MVKPQETADLDTFTEEIFTGKLHILSSVTGIRCQFDCALIALNPITLGAQQMMKHTLKILQQILQDFIVKLTIWRTPT